MRGGPKVDPPCVLGFWSECLSHNPIDLNEYRLFKHCVRQLNRLIWPIVIYGSCGDLRVYNKVVFALTVDPSRFRRAFCVFGRKLLQMYWDFAMFLMRGKNLKKSHFLYGLIDVCLFPQPGGAKSGSPRYRVIYLKNTYIIHCECTILGLVGTSAFTVNLFLH